MENTNLDTPQKRLKHFIYKYYDTVTNFAGLLDITQGALNVYINGPKVYTNDNSTERLKKLGLNPVWYLYGEGEMAIKENILEHHGKYNSKKDDTKTNEKKINGREIYRLPNSFKGILANIKLHIMSVNAATGTLTSLEDMPSSILPLAIGMNLDSETHEALYVNGESMEDAGVSNGDIVIFEATSSIPEYDCMIVGSLNGYPIMKNLCHKEGTIFLKSASKVAKDIVLGDLEELELFGIVKKVIKDHVPRRNHN